MKHPPDSPLILFHTFLNLITAVRTHGIKLFTFYLYLLLGITNPANSAITTYTNETSYLAALSALGKSVIAEGFEDNIVWGKSRGTIPTPGSTPSISNQGLIWQSNLPAHGVGTDNFTAQGASYRFFSSPHGKTFNPNMQNGCDAAAAQGIVPPECWQNDGWSIQAAQPGTTLYGVGGWFSSASGAAKITYLLDGVDILPNNTNRDGHRVSINWTFFGVIDTTGFSKAEVQEMGGKAGAPQFIYGDSFSVGLSNSATLTQRITFTAPTGALVGGTGTLNASASSNLTVRFSGGSPTVCTVTGNTVKYLTAGTCIIHARQAGDATYQAAPLVSVSFPVVKLNQIITFNPPTTGTVRGQLRLSATSDANLTVFSFSSSTAATCTVSGNTVHFIAPGVCSLLASQAGNATYQSARQRADINLSLDTVAPAVTAPSNITVDSIGLRTPVNLGQGRAQDNLDGALSPAADLHGPFAPGIYTITWTATDQEGNTGSAIQQLTVYPQINMSPNIQVVEGETVTLTAYLNGTVPFTVSAPYTVSGTATRPADHNLSDGSITFPSNSLQTHITFNTIQDNIADPDETVITTLGTPTNAAPGQHARQTTRIREINLAPRASLRIKQGTLPTRIVVQTAGQATMTATVQDANPGDTHRYDWSMTDNALLDTDNNANNAAFVFDPSTLTEGIYNMQVTVTDSGTPALSHTAMQQIRIVARQATLSTTLDSDGDGIPDATEGYGDTDADGLPDYLDASSASNILPLDARQSQGSVFETEPGLQLTLGQTAFAKGIMGGRMTQNTLPIQDSSTHVGGYFDFVISNLAAVGDSATIVLPLNAPIPPDPVYRLLKNTGWQTFVQDTRNQLRSAAGSQGTCPPPGDAAYQAGLTAGHHCVALTIEDGGPNDLDQLTNGEIVDPGGVAINTPTTTNPTSSATATTSATTGSGGGGFLQSTELLILSLLTLASACSGIRHRRPYGNQFMRS